MAIYFVTGKLGQGKTLCSVSRIKLKLEAGLPIATNIDLDIGAMFNVQTKNTRVTRLPDKPKAADLKMLGYGNKSYDEAKNGLIVLDECGTWFNSRNWNDKDRQAVNAWFLHARKYGWDVILIVQDISIVDKQAREALAEHTVFCRRMDSVHVPFLGTIYKLLTGMKLKLPRFHIGKVILGDNIQGIVSDRWVYRGNSLFDAYDTKQLFLEDYNHGVHSILPPFYTDGRYVKYAAKVRIMKLTRIYWKRFSRPLLFALGLTVGTSCAAAGMNALHPDPQEPLTFKTKPQLDQVAASEAVVSVEPLIDMSEFFDGYVYSGYIQKGDREVFMFSHNEKPILTSYQLRNVGIQVIAEDVCTARLIQNNTKFHFISCLQM